MIKSEEFQSISFNAF